MIRTTLIASVAALGLSGCIIVDSDRHEAPAAKYAAGSLSQVSSSDRRMIEAAVMDYFEGQTEGSFERLDRAFNPDASMVGVVDDEAGDPYLRVWPKMSEVIPNWSRNPDPQAAPRDGEILAMDVIDGRIATVHFRSTDRFYDALTLVKIDGQWEIASKVFVLQ